MTHSFRSAIILFVGLVLFSAGTASAAPYIGKPKTDANTRMTYPSVISAEVLGRGMIGSIYFDQAIMEDLVAGIGFSVVPTNYLNSNISTGRNAIMFPTYVNYYLSRSPGSFFGTAGVNLVANGDYVRNSESAVGSLVFSNNNSSIVPTFGAGYESRGDNGFLFRITAYGLLGDKLTGWVGFSFGLGF